MCSAWEFMSYERQFRPHVPRARPAAPGGRQEPGRNGGAGRVSELPQLAGLGGGPPRDERGAVGAGVAQDGAAPDAGRDTRRAHSLSPWWRLFQRVGIAFAELAGSVGAVSESRKLSRSLVNPALHVGEQIGGGLGCRA